MLVKIIISVKAYVSANIPSHRFKLYIIVRTHTANRIYVINSHGETNLIFCIAHYLIRLQTDKALLSYEDTNIQGRECAVCFSCLYP
jgi:hypothetical protein